MKQISLFLLIAFVSISCSNLSNKSAPENYGRLIDSATTRGGFIVTGPIKDGEHGWPFGAYFGDISNIGYVDKVRAAALQTEELGVILPYIAEQYIREAETASTPTPLEDSI